MTKLVFAQIDSMKLTPVDQSYVDKVTETDLRTRETDFKENSYWRGALRSAYEEYWDPIEVLTYADEVIRKLNLSDVQAAANRYLNTENYARFSLVPEPGLIENPETK